MSEHINKLGCGPRALMIIAEKIGTPIDPDKMWERFFSKDDNTAKPNGAIYLSTILDIAREYGIARHIDVTRDIVHAAEATVANNVAGVLMITERLPNSSVEGFAIHRHIWGVIQILADNHSQLSVETESANQGEPSRVDILPEALLTKMLYSFLVLVK